MDLTHLDPVVLGWIASGVSGMTGLLIKNTVDIASLKTELKEIRKDLPNGEIKELTQMVRDIHEAMSSSDDDE